MRTIILRITAMLLTGMVTAAPILPAGAQTSQPIRAILVDPYAGHIAEASRRFGIPAGWIRAVMRAESAGDPRAVSRAGAIGLMQVMPATWADLRVRHRLGANPYDPRNNILAGTAYLRELHDRYGNVAAMLAAYNAGPSRYEASLSGRPLPTETRAYVATIALVINGGAIVTPVVVAAVDPLAWTHAALFAARPERRPVADPLPAARSSKDAASTPPVRDVSAIVPQSSGLFVVRAETEVRR